MSPELYDRATRALQGYLSAHNPRVVVDGKFGAFTTSMYEALAGSDKLVADRIVSGMGTTAKELAAFRGEQKLAVEPLTGSDTRYVEWAKAKAMVERAARRLGVSDDLIPILQDFLRIEAAKKTVNGVTYLDALSKNGSSRGLGQIQAAAWNDARKIDKSLPGYDRVFDPEVNISAMVAYAIWLMRGMPKNVPVNAETLYLSYNQGLGFWSGSRSNVKGQSAEVQRLVAKYS